MFPLKLKGKCNNICIVDENGICTSINSMNILIKKAEAILIKGNFNRVAIKDPDKAVSTALVIACLNTGTDFIIIPSNKSFEFNIRLNLFEVDLIFDNQLHPYFLSVSLQNSKIYFDETLRNVTRNDELVGILDDISDAIENYESIKLFKSRYECEMGIHHVIHSGNTLAEGLRKYSGFGFNAIYKGIEKACHFLSNEYESTIAYIEEFDLLYDIVNGIIAPLLCRKKVIFINVNNDLFRYNTYINKSYTLYTSNKRLEEILNPMYDKQLSLVKMMTTCSRAWLRYDFRKYLGRNPSNIIITGKINNPNLLNLFSNKITALYTMADVASFIAKKNWKKINDVTNVGNTTDDIVIAGKAPRAHGIIMLYSRDMSHITNESLVNQSFIHNFKGRLNTNDVGYFSNESELHIVNKSNLVFEKDRKIINIDELLEFVKKQSFIENATLIKSKGSFPLVLISPSKSFMSARKLDLDDIYELILNLQDRLNFKFKHIFSGNLKVILFELDIKLDEEILKVLAGH